MSLGTYSEESDEEAEIEAQNQLFEQAEDKQIDKEDEQRGHIFVLNPEFQGAQSLTEEDKEDRIVNKTVARLQELMAANGYMRGPPPQNIAGEIEVDSEINFNLNANVNRSIMNHSQGMDKVVRTNPTTQMNAEIGAQAIPATSVETSNSDAMLYQTAVQPGSNRSPNVVVQNKVSTEPNHNKSNRRLSGWGMSSSDEDQVNTSDELNDQINIHLNSLCSHNFSAGNQQDEPVLTTSDGRGDQEIRSRNNANQDGRRLTPPAPTIQQRVDNLIRDAENAKVKINDVQGTNKVVNFSYDNDPMNDLQNKLMHPAMEDKDYLVVAAHVDESVAKKIRGGKYVDFAKILPRDRVQDEQNTCLQTVTMQDGHLGCTSTTDQSSVITSFAKWEQAFHVYSNIYSRQYPQRASELIQYNHVIHTVAMTYSWSNVYAYDIDFRLHMARHPLRSRLVILQQAWNLRLREKNNNFTDRRKKRRDICFRFNRGHCGYRDHCKFDHRCDICGKHGHGAYNCRRGTDRDTERKENLYNHSDRQDKERSNGNS